ncbi:Ig-like domain-containing protein [Bacillus sp. 3255]|uniref:Ig-like domain-containing protein n=1 Tax=Bacillus sp. 3255 TaxID=2817904 RepID=UPI0028630CFD|nr:S-layer homology domain-containing protein [Bacillus sp. 3255]MDR6879531.1 hypothetical protein [Bacillus sp. 3255]
MKKNYWLAALFSLMLPVQAVPAFASDQQPFTDIQDSYAKEAIIKLYKDGIISGTGEHLFEPSRRISRQDVALLLVHALQLDTGEIRATNSFSDIPVGHYAYEAVETLHKLGVVNGISEDQFGADVPITREEIAAILMRIGHYLKNGQGVRLAVQDKEAVSDWAKDYVQAAIESGIMVGDGVNFHPKDNLQRQEAVQVIFNFILNHKNFAVVQNVSKDSVVLNGTTYKIPVYLQGILNEDNNPVLQDAFITFTSYHNTIQRITSLEITKGGKEPRSEEKEFTGNLVFNGHGAVLDGTLYIGADFITLKDMYIKKDLVIGEEAKNDFYSESIRVDGSTLVNGGSQDTVVFQDATLNSVEINKQNVRVEPIGQTSVSQITVNSSSTIQADSNITIPKLTIADGANNVSLNAAVSTLEVSGTQGKTLSGTSNIATLTITEGASVNLATTGSVGTLQIVSDASKLTLGSTTTVNSLVIPENISVSSVVSNYNQVSSQVGTVSTPTSTTTTTTTTTTNSTNTNHAPLVAKPVAPQQINLYGGEQTISISETFQDQDNDSLKLTATSRNPGIVAATLNGTDLTLKPISLGTAVIILGANDGKKTTSSSISVTVFNGNRAPQASEVSIPDQLLSLGKEPVAIDLSDKFSDPEGNPLTYEAKVIPSDLVTTVVKDNKLYLSTEATSGKAVVTVTAADGNGGVGSRSFNANINEAPAIVTPIPEQKEMTEGGPSVSLELTEYIKDPEGNALTFAVNSQDQNVATADLVGSKLTITPLYAGSTKVNVTAEDPFGRTVTCEVTVDINGNPSADKIIANQIVTINGNELTVGLADVFSDQNGDHLNYRVKVKDESIVSADIAPGSTNLLIRGQKAGSTQVTVTAEDGRGGSVSTSFEVLSNQAPKASSIDLNEQMISIGIDPIEIDLEDKFADLDGDELSYEVKSEHPEIVVSVMDAAKKKLLLSTVASSGESKVTITANDGKGGSVTREIYVKVNQAPLIANNMLINDLTEGGPSKELDVQKYFADPEGQPLTFKANPQDLSKATVQVNGSKLTVTPLLGGTTKVTVTAEDTYGRSVSSELDLIINNNPVAGNLESIPVTIGVPYTVDLGNIFSDADGDQLTYTAVSSQEGTVTASVYDGNKLHLNALQAATGSINVTVSANDGKGGSSSKDLQVEVNHAPTATVFDPIDLEKSFSTEISLSGMFQDVDQDTLSFKAVSEKPSTVTAYVNEDGLLKLTGLMVGASKVSVTAEDGKGGTVTTDVYVNVIPRPNSAPIGLPINDQTLQYGDSPLNLDLSSYFSDSDKDELTYSVLSSDLNSVTAAVYGSSLQITAAGVGFATVQVTADDDFGGKTDNQFDVLVTDPAANQPPVLSAVPTRTVVQGSPPLTMDLANYFTDPEGDVLSFKAISDDTSVADVSLNGSLLSISPGLIGTTTVTASVYDGTNPWLKSSFKVIVKRPNVAPIVASSISDKLLTLGVQANAISLTGVFQDADGDGLTYTATSSDTAIVDTAISGNELTLTAQGVGTGTITVTTNDGMGGFTNTSFQVTVKDANKAPEVSSTIADKLLILGDPTDPISLASLFQDNDGDTLTYTAVSSDSSLVGTSVSGNNLQLQLNGKGTATVTVTANDGKGGTVDTSFKVRVLKAETLTINTKSGIQNISFDIKTYFPTQPATELKVIPQPLSGILSNYQLTLTTGMANGSTLIVAASDDTGLRVKLMIEQQTTRKAFISDYVDGSNGRAAIQVYYPDDGMSGMQTGYELFFYQWVNSTNKARVWSLPFLPFYPGMPYIIINSNFYDFFDITNAAYYNDEAFFSLDGYTLYALVLKKDGQVVDVIGNPVENPTIAPPSILPKGGTIVRKSGILSGSQSFSPFGEWDSFPKDTFTNLGRHQP